MIVNTNGDVVLKVLRNDFGAHPLGSPPGWQPVPGMGEFIDDHLAINSGSQPLTSGRGGFGMAVTEVTRCGYFDHLGAEGPPEEHKQMLLLANAPPRTITAADEAEVVASLKQEDGLSERHIAHALSKTRHWVPRRLEIERSVSFR